jgi:hypothetical protein
MKFSSKWSSAVGPVGRLRATAQQIAMSRLLMIVLLALPLPSWAALFCIADAADFYPALQTVATSLEDDEIRLTSGVMSGLGNKLVTVNGDLRVSGGWTNSICTARPAATTLTTLTASSTINLDLNMRGGELDLERLRFVNWNRIRIVDGANTAQEVVGTVSIHRSNFSALTVGFVALLGKHDLRITSSIFSANGGEGLSISSSSGGNFGTKAILQYNTFSGNETGLRINTAINPWASILVESSVMNNNSVNDLSLSGQEMIVRHSFWNSAFIAGSASLSVDSVNNRSGDAGLDGGLRPLEPTSQLINHAFSGFTLPVSDDYDGGARVIGTHGDIGAYESAVNNATTLTVSNLNDSGIGSLRQAIINANTNPAHKTIEFNISGACPRLINLQSDLPDVTEPVTIDGYSQPGSAPNESGSAFDGTVCVFLLGGNARSNGLDLRPGVVDTTITVQGLGFYGFTNAGTYVSGDGRAIIRGNLFGTGANVLNQLFVDTAIHVRDAPGTMIGGPDLASRNVIGLAAYAGIYLDRANARRTIHGNLIGVDRNGSTGALANAVGVLVIGGSDDLILKNTIAFNTAQGVLINGTGHGLPDAQGIRIESNKIGRTSTSDVGGNGSNGVRIEAGAGHRVFGNQIWNNGTDGVVVLDTSRGNLIAHNTYVNNALQAIDLSPDGINFNDLDVGQTGANDRQNYPTILGASGSDSQGDVRVNLSSANGSYHVQLLLSSNCDAPLSQGRFVLATTVSPVALPCATPTSNCSKAITIPVSNAEFGLLGLIGSGITSIAWDEENNTSEVSPCVVYQQGALVFRDSFE